jgi:hypothetical protein
VSSDAKETSRRRAPPGIELRRDPVLRFIQVGEQRGARMINAPEASLKEPLASLIPVLLTELYEHRHEEAIVEDQPALSVVTARCNMNGL